MIDNQQVTGLNFSHNCYSHTLSGKPTFI